MQIKKTLPFTYVIIDDKINLQKERTKIMLKIFISSHGHLASGMKSSLDILIGNSDRIHIFDAYVDEKSVQEVLDEFYKTVKEDDQIILLSDLLGGSVNSTMFLYLDRPNTTLIAGINLALVLELAVHQDNLTKEEIEKIVKDSREVLKIIENTNEPVVQDDFF
ncbi:MAG: PTS sugar transporter subunit IIA [Bacilli bacterium]